jgi:hypothetical protein
VTPEDFSNLVHMRFRVCEDILIDKAREYAPGDDRLHNFKVAAQLQGTDPKRALAGMMAKHTISIYDMCLSDQIFPNSVWEEKIVDHINYLFLLSAIVTERPKKGVVEVIKQGTQTTIDSFLDSIDKSMKDK